MAKKLDLFHLGYQLGICLRAVRRQSESFGETEERAEEVRAGTVSASAEPQEGRLCRPHRVSSPQLARGSRAISSISVFGCASSFGRWSRLASEPPSPEAEGRRPSWVVVLVGAPPLPLCLRSPLLSAPGRPPRSRPRLPPHPAPSAAAPADPPTPRAFPLCGDRRETSLLSHEQLSPRENPTVGLGDLSCTVCA